MLTQKERELLERHQFTEKINAYYEEVANKVCSILDEVFDEEFEQLLENEFLEEHPDFKDESEDEVLEAGGSEFVMQKISDVMGCIVEIIINRIREESDDETDKEEVRSIEKGILSILNENFGES